MWDSDEELRFRENADWERQETFDRAAARIYGAQGLIMVRDSEYLWAVFRQEYGDIYLVVGVNTL